MARANHINSGCTGMMGSDPLSVGECGIIDRDSIVLIPRETISTPRGMA